MASRRSYWLVVNGVRAAYKLTLPEGREAWRQLRDRLGRAPYGVDVERHPRIVREEVRDAKLAIVERALEKPIDYVRAPPVQEPIDYVDYGDDVTAEWSADTEGDT